MKFYGSRGVGENLACPAYPTIPRGRPSPTAQPVLSVVAAPSARAGASVSPTLTFVRVVSAEPHDGLGPNATATSWVAAPSDGSLLHLLGRRRWGGGQQAAVAACTASALMPRTGVLESLDRGRTHRSPESRSRLATCSRALRLTCPLLRARFEETPPPSVVASGPPVREESLLFPPLAPASLFGGGFRRVPPGCLWSPPSTRGLSREAGGRHGVL